MFYEDQGPRGGGGRCGSCPDGRVVAMASVVIVAPLCASCIVPRSSNDHGGFIPVRQTGKLRLRGPLTASRAHG